MSFPVCNWTAFYGARGWVLMLSFYGLIVVNDRSGHPQFYVTLESIYD